MDIDTRIANLTAATAHGATIEHELLRAGILAIAPVLTQHPGSSRPLAAVLETRRISFFKRFRDQNVRLCSDYGQHPYDVPLNEVVAWRLAHAMGHPWDQLVPTAVLRQIDGHGGALINQKDGIVDLAVFDGAKGQVLAAAFWDALIGNQDRNSGNYRYDAKAHRLGLIDHGFCFARPGDHSNYGSYFLGHRRRNHQQGTGITAQERHALQALIDSGDLHGLRSYLPADRCDALEARATEMLRAGCLPLVHVF